MWGWRLGADPICGKENFLLLLTIETLGAGE